MGGRTRTVSASSDFSEYFHEINDRQVDDISIEFFYKPHTITLLLLSVGTMLYMAFTRDETVSHQNNIWTGMCCATFFFLVISVLTFPNGPFTRPHPALWRLVFGCSVLYLMFLVFILFQDYETVRSILVFFYPELQNFTIDMDESNWGQNCNPLTFDKIWSSLDIFAFAHLFGWMMKALLIRHYGLLWTISIMWEVTELLFAHLLPNFIECWWDAIILDILLCNGVGIYIGMKVCRWLEMRDYKWESIKDISTTSGKVKRALMQFTPESWIQVRWMDSDSPAKRVLSVSLLVIAWQLTELNTFFLKHVFQMPPHNPFNAIRILCLGPIVAPTIRQYYLYVTDRRVKRMGTQCWVYICITLSEAFICFKFGRELFKQTVVTNVLIWLLLQMVITFVCVYLCVTWNRRREIKDVGNDSGLGLNSSVLDTPQPGEGGRRPSPSADRSADLRRRAGGVSARDRLNAVASGAAPRRSVRLGGAVSEDGDRF
ncbi:phosphatidylserine synthase-like [Amphibalanus amphitrite]|uniref:phosphatidylserine synthase-like n=1 Tax=Amphibalanus amphitrite TaxID=1232801 RepID=UPI001C91B106|nr:phosphatidylserine synthase-like [Amphibalanus amphitrite]XP_043238192.1 phosphatidylserine synthase-like [Amphibalanus amphitrite]XP_043238193.1 phosphatidylserine synthase-like [Amphibalanus amphitrite]XP_043238194.1 phosphatidylserine synthase-like [Amphibalanus amphitrite]XP_043238195.1 phosphatidylserine synthase-like [Amphibalanus amphitrite]XP_043238196.1 phosphatidylserine synthase-like [Amphibalanus amphitrite]XP_043238197.1 phosphatidylserine synthase-like [Amphibalanus amphitrit